MSKEFELDSLAEKQSQLVEQYSEIIDSDNYQKIDERLRRFTTAQILDNQFNLNEDASLTTASMASYDPVVINMVRRSVPWLIAYDICGVQPMSGPTGLAFAMKARYGTGTGDEALYNKVKTGYSGDGTDDSSYNDGTDNPFLAGTLTGKIGTGGETKAMETGEWNKMSASIEKVTLNAKTRHLKAELSIEVQQDWRAVHNIDAQYEMSNILAQDILVEKNQELVRTIYRIARVGAQKGTQSAGTFSLKDDSDGRWAVERYKGLLHQIYRDANQIAIDTRRGRGNFIITSADVASALQMAGVLDFAPALAAQTNMDVQIAGTSYAGNIGPMRVYIDPYLQYDGYVVGYKGSNQYDAGLIYAPYIHLQPAKAVNSDNFNTAIGFKTRYDIVANPFTTLNDNDNMYYRKVAVKL